MRPPRLGPPPAQRRLPTLPTALLLLAVLLAGCAPDDAVIEEALESATGEQAPDGGADPPGGGCEPAVAEAVDDVLAAQLAAFAAQDWEAAWQHASDAFRHSVDADGLARIIEEGFPVVAEAASHAIERCEQRGDRVTALVAVVGRSGEEALLAYELVSERGAWAVDAAVTLEGRGQGDLIAGVVGRHGADGTAPVRRSGDAAPAGLPAGPGG